MAEYVSDHRDRRRGGTGRAPEWEGRGDAAVNPAVDGDRLLMLNLIYVWTVGEGGRAGPRDGYTSLESLRRVSGLPARRVWELVDELQDLELVSCIWDSRASTEQAGESRFFRCTQVSLTAEGLSYPPLHDYHRLQDQENRDEPDEGQPRRRETGRERRRPELEREPEREPARRSEQRPERESEREHRPPRGYRVYRPQEHAMRRLKALACAFALLILAVLVTLLTLI